MLSKTLTLSLARILDALRPHDQRPAEDDQKRDDVADSLAKLNCTRIVVAHRLSTVRECDRILVVAGGGIAEEGSYDELIERGGLFADLVARQRVDGE